MPFLGSFRRRTLPGNDSMQSCRLFGAWQAVTEQKKQERCKDENLSNCRDIFPLWNWRHIPGTTSYDVDTVDWKSRNRAEDCAAEGTTVHFTLDRAGSRPARAGVSRRRASTCR